MPALAAVVPAVAILALGPAPFAHRPPRPAHKPNCRTASCVHLGRPEAASWYYDEGEGTACGFHATLGVAHKTLPCGTRVELCCSRCAVVTVQDRGPYVWPREWDLNPAARDAIGLPGLGDVRAAVLR